MNKEILNKLQKTYDQIQYMQTLLDDNMAEAINDYLLTRDEREDLRFQCRAISNCIADLSKDILPSDIVHIKAIENASKYDETKVI